MKQTIFSPSLIQEKEEVVFIEHNTGIKDKFNYSEEDEPKTDLFKPALSPDVDTIFKLNRKLKDFNFILENMIFYSEFGIEERTKKEQVTIPEDLLGSIEDLLFDINWTISQVDLLKRTLFQGKIS